MPPQPPRPQPPRPQPPRPQPPQPRPPQPRPPRPPQPRPPQPRPPQPRPPRPPQPQPPHQAAAGRVRASAANTRRTYTASFLKSITFPLHDESTGLSLNNFYNNITK